MHMTPSMPLCCTPGSFEMLRRHMGALDSSDGLLHGAVSIAMHQMPSADPVRVDATIQSYADTVRKRVRGTQTQALLAHLHAHLFDEVGFSGNSENYYVASNSYLPAVLNTKRGLPITLCLIYKLVGQRLGLRVHGIGLPGHFMCGVETDQGVMLIDPFSGG